MGWERRSRESGVTEGVALNWVTEESAGDVVWDADAAKTMSSILDQPSLKCRVDA